MLHAIVHPADIQDRDGGILLLATLFGMYPFLKKLFADGGYQGPDFQKALAKILPHLTTEIVKRSDHAKGFVVLPRRWVVERTIAWLNRCRRLVKDWENLNRTALAFLRLASIRLMLRKLCNPARCSRTDSKELSFRRGNPVIVVNKTGASGNPGAGRASDRPPQPRAARPSRGPDPFPYLNGVNFGPRVSDLRLGDFIDLIFSIKRVPIPSKHTARNRRRGDRAIASRRLLPCKLTD